MKKSKSEIKQYNLDEALYKLHKDEGDKSNFGLDNSSELIDGGFGLYSSANIKSSIGPIKTQYFRIALIKAGTAKFGIGIETYQPTKNNIVFGFPGQVFSLDDKTDDFFVYYMLFSEAFISETAWLLKEGKEAYPFMTYSGVQSFSLSEEEAQKVENLILKINFEVKNRKSDIKHIIRLYIQLILIHANRSYERQGLAKQETDNSHNSLFRRFIKLVSHHFLTIRKVADYALMLHINSDHLNRVIKSQSQKTANELIDDMLLMEAKSYLRQTDLSNAEIAYLLEFSDPSHFNKFFKKHTLFTPLEYRNKS